MVTDFENWSFIHTNRGRKRMDSTSESFCGNRNETFRSNKSYHLPLPSWKDKDIYKMYINNINLELFFVNNH